MVERRTASAQVDGNARRRWVHDAIGELRSEERRAGATPLLRCRLDGGVDLYVKDESVHPSGSLKHRLARALFLHALCSGWIGPETTIVEASSGSTAVSEAWFARSLGLRFVAVIPRATAPEKVRAIEALDGTCQFVDDASATVETARELAVDGGHFMDQFRYAERAIAWMTTSNLAAETLDQMRLEPHAEPAWFVVGAGTGGTATTVGRTLRHRSVDSRLCVVDPPGSRLLHQWAPEPDEAHASGCADGTTVIEGIGRPRHEASFITDVVDSMIRVPDAASIAGMFHANELLERRVGGSTGTNVIGALRLAEMMQREGRAGSVVTLLCDGGDRYTSTLYAAQWLDRHVPRSEIERWQRGIETASVSELFAGPVAARPEPASGAGARHRDT